MKRVTFSIATGAITLCVMLVYLGFERQSLRVQIAELSDRAALHSPRQFEANRYGSATPIPQTDYHSIPSSESRNIPGARVIQEIMSTQEGRAYQLLMARQALPLSYPDFEKVLGLDSSEAERFSNLLAAQINEWIVIYEEARERNSLATPEVQRQLSERKQSNEVEIAAMLGSKYSKWLEYQPTVPIRLQVRALQARLSSDPLSNSQIEPLVSALTAQMPYLGSGRSNPNHDGQILDVAALYLNARQLEGFRQMLEEEKRRYLQGRASASATLPASSPHSATPAGTTSN